VQDEVNQDYSEQNEVDGMKKGAETSYTNRWITLMSRYCTVTSTT